MKNDNLHNVVVFIKDEAELQQARGILERYEQPMCEPYFATDIEKWNYLQLDDLFDDWLLTYKKQNSIEITLSELEQLLKQKIDEKS